MTNGDFGDDLLARARRAPLSDAEERRLRELVATSTEARLLYEAGCAFDREAPVQAGDDARIARMLREVEKRQASVARRAPPRRLGRALATGLLLGTAAVAALELSRGVFVPGYSGNARPAVPSGAVVPAARALSQALTAEVPPVAAPAGSVPLAADGAVHVPHVPHVPSGGTPPIAQGAALSAAPAAVGSADFEPLPAPSASAAELFSAANRERVAGRLESAITAYRRLEVEFPSSSEAVTARLSLGMLYLQTGDAPLALEEFRAYRALSHGPSLAEALFGEARALGRLGRRDEERARLRELLEKFPRSAYTAAAEKRLAEP